MTFFRRFLHVQHYLNLLKLFESSKMDSKKLSESISMDSINRPQSIPMDSIINRTKHTIEKIYLIRRHEENQLESPSATIVPNFAIALLTDV